jgi:hypothetical protein
MDARVGAANATLVRAGAHRHAGRGQGVIQALARGERVRRCADGDAGAAGRARRRVRQVRHFIVFGDAGGRRRRPRQCLSRLRFSAKHG